MASVSSSQVHNQKGKRSDQFDATDFGGTAPLEEASEQTSQHLTELRIIIGTPHMKRGTISLLASPYPMPPLKITSPIKPLATQPIQLKNMLIASGYTRKLVTETAYPYGGWRWRYAYEAAVKKSGRSEPHFIGASYFWAKGMIPYAKEECERSNDQETERHNRYVRAEEEYQRNHVDMETDAVRKGYGPTEVHCNRLAEQGREGRVHLGPGDWWVVATMKVPGLTYYWQQPVQIIEGEQPVVLLNEDNALSIQGAW